MTRLDWFKSMNAEEIGKYLERFSNKICDNYDSCDYCPLHFGKNFTCDKYGFIEWFNKEINENDEL